MTLLQKLGCGQAEVQESIRTVHIGVGDPHPQYLDNYTRTTKYTLLTFLPKALYEQYRRVANIYFTIVAALSLTEFSPVRPWTTWLPLVIVLGVSIIKEGREDYKRHKADNEVNNREVEVLDVASKEYVRKRWMDVRVGDIIIVKKDQFFAADLLFLTAENEEGTCYVETMNLDGETNLKIKKALDETKDMRHGDLVNFKADIECEGPNSRLYEFTGNLRPGQDIKVPISPAAVLLRGCTLRNTERIYGAVIYAGHESKIFKNSTVAPSKRSKVERILDKIIYFMFFILFSMCMCGCIYFAFWTSHAYPHAWYMDPTVTNVQYNNSRPVVVAITNFITVFILYGYLIPISLYVTVELVKMAQSMVFIALDRDMYHAETDTPALARTSNLNEELGMVNTVLSDKTGTLTRNVMEFFKCSVAGVSYGAGVTEIEKSNAERQGLTLDTTPSPEALQYRERFFNFYDARLMDGNIKTAHEPHIVEMFFRLLAVCHTVIPDGPQTPSEIKYEAESPDEAALVVAAKVMGFFFFKRTNTSVTVRETTRDGTRDVEYKVLNILEFNSTRKRMSVIVQDDTGKILLFCKGADTVIYERLDPSHPLNMKLKDPTTQHMQDYGSAGLRTLCLSYAELDAAFYEQWQQQFVEAKTSLQDRDAKLDAVSELVERRLVLLGCTAIEDKLQEGVPQCIKQLARAGIRLWVLTGDKRETAINIGFACSLLTEDMDQFIVSAYTPELEALEAEGKAEDAARLGHERIRECLEGIKVEMTRQRFRGKYAMVIDGKALSFALSKGLNQLFLEVGLHCAAVICCRVSPLQKAQVTELVRNHGDITLAIGDGANDVGMIQKAHIGVGISGQEGMQAVMAADFAIAQFRFLTPLLLVHGRWSYKRITRMINFFFFKNLLFGTTIFTYNAFTAFSGQYMYNDFYMTLYNVVFTSLTPFVIGAFDRDVDRDMALRFPCLYKQGQRNQYLDFKAICGWLLSSLFQCAVIMVVILIGWDARRVGHPNGQAFGMFETGITMFSVVIVTVHLQIVQITEQWTVMHHIAIWLSQLVWWLFLLAFGAFPISLSGDLYYLFVGVVAPNAQYWLYVLLVPLACQLPDFAWRQVRRHLYPEEHHIVQELYLKERLERKATDHLVSEEFGESGTNVVLQVFGAPEVQRKNKGFVPPYHKDSKFYKFVNSTFRSSPYAAPQGSGSGGSGVPQGMAQVRSPVLTHLDQEMAQTTQRSERHSFGGNNRCDTGVAVAPALPSSAPNAHRLPPQMAGAYGTSVNGAATPNRVSNSGAAPGDALMKAYMGALK